MTSYIPIASQTLSSSTTSVAFTSIPTTIDGKTIRDLVLIAQFRPDTNSSAWLQFNNSNSGYFYQRLSGSGTSASASRATASAILLQDVAFSETSTDTFLTIQIYDFAQTDKHKHTLTRNNVATLGTELFLGRWANLSAINSVKFTSQYGMNYLSGSIFSLYGIEG